MARILLKVPLSPRTGYGNDGIALARALDRAGHDLTLLPYLVDVPLPMEVARLLTRAIEPPYDVLLHHADPDNCGLLRSEDISANVKVFWTMWEWTDIGVMKSGASIAERLDHYDHLLLYVDVTMESLAPLTEAPATKLQGGYWSEDWIQPPAKDWDGVLRFGMLGMLNTRKQPFLAVEAFDMLINEVGPGKVELHLKTLLQSFHPMMEERYPGLKIHFRNWTHEQTKAFYGQMHCYVAPSLGEGKNLPAMEAATAGCAVIATAVGGHLEWMSDEWAYLVKGHPIDVGQGCYGVEITAEDLAAAMLHVYNNRDEAREKGLLAARTVPAQCDWAQVIRRLDLILPTVTPRLGRFQQNENTGTEGKTEGT